MSSVYHHDPTRIRAELTIRGWTPSMLAVRSGVHTATVRRMLDPAAKRKVVQGRTLELIARALELGPWDIATDYPAPPKAPPLYLPGTERYHRGDERWTPRHVAALRRFRRQEPEPINKPVNTWAVNNQEV